MCLCATVEKRATTADTQGDDNKTHFAPNKCNICTDENVGKKKERLPPAVPRCTVDHLHGDR